MASKRTNFFQHKQCSPQPVYFTKHYSNSLIMHFQNKKCYILVSMQQSPKFWFDSQSLRNTLSAEGGIITTGALTLQLIFSNMK